MQILSSIIQLNRFIHSVALLFIKWKRIWWGQRWHHTLQMRFDYSFKLTVKGVLIDTEAEQQVWLCLSLLSTKDIFCVAYDAGTWGGTVSPTAASSSISAPRPGCPLHPHQPCPKTSWTLLHPASTWVLPRGTASWRHLLKCPAAVCSEIGQALFTWTVLFIKSVT